MYPAEWQRLTIHPKKLTRSLLSPDLQGQCGCSASTGCWHWYAHAKWNKFEIFLHGRQHFSLTNWIYRQCLFYGCTDRRDNILAGCTFSFSYKADGRCHCEQSLPLGFPLPMCVWIFLFPIQEDHDDDDDGHKQIVLVTVAVQHYQRIRAHICCVSSGWIRSHTYSHT